jgi:hypothetical protein
MKVTTPKGAQPPSEWLWLVDYRERSLI